jgi:isoleucyl-tRNA synthetase
MIDKQLERDMDAVLNVAQMGRACRNTANIKNRQPVSKIYLSGVDHLDEVFLDVIRGELNVKEIELGAAAEEFISYNIKPQLKTVGPKYGKLLNKIREHLQNADGIAVVSTIRAGGVYTFDVDGSAVELSEADLLIEPTQKPGFMVETSEKYAVIIDTKLTPELIEEGYVREIVSKVQTMRKEAGFEVTDHIRLSVARNELIQNLLQKNEAQIAKETLSDVILYGTTGGYTKEWDINGEATLFGVEKL